MTRVPSKTFAVPASPKIYHITHVDNLAKIIEAGRIWSDRERLDQGIECSLVGMSRIKQRRLDEIEVDCHTGTKVGEYVPFYFCSRSIMLYILHMGNSADITYRGGQTPIVHLRSDLSTVIDWAQEQKVRWAFSDRNAGAFVAKFKKRRQDLTMVNWSAVANTDFRDSVVKEGKQAEFLVHKAFPWELVESIGVRNEHIRGQVQAAVRKAGHKPPVTVEKDWYY